MEIPWQIKNVFFFSIFFAIHATMGITIKVVARAPTHPKSVGHTPALAESPLNR